MLDWVIVGGGIHGVHLASCLVHRGVAPHDIRIVDPGPRLLHQWHRCTKTTGMAYLRSPIVHHLDRNPYGLKHFARSWTDATRPLYQAPYRRPSVELFAAHCDHVIARDRLDEAHLVDRVVGIHLRDDAAEVLLGSGDVLMARHVLLAIGASEQPHRPEWAAGMPDTPVVRHVFAADTDPHLAEAGDAVAIVGGGITAGQVALRLADGRRKVYLLMRHAPRTHTFDSDPGWLGPKNMTPFRANPDPAWRRRTILKARHRGSMPRTVVRRLKGAIDRGALIAVRADVQGAEAQAGQIVLDLGDAKLPTARVDTLYLATGFDSARPGGAWLDAVRDAHALRCADCGYPLVDRALRWHPRLFVTGPLAELELGPVSRNIAGARRAADRILAVA